MPSRRSLLAAALGLALLACVPTPGRAACAGDCDGSGSVSIAELVLAVNIALERAPASSCPGACPNPPICIDYLLAAVGAALDRCPIEIPALASSEPADGATNIPGTAWIRLEFSGPVDPADLRFFELSCEDVGLRSTATVLAPNVVLINPGDALFDTCHVVWQGGSIEFRVAPADTAPTVLYDHDDARRTSPFPDDAWTVAASTSTGLRLALPLPQGPADLQQIFNGLLPETNKLDGFSPVAYFVVELSAAPDRTTLPLTPAASLDPLATVGLFDLTPGSPTYGQRVPFRREPRTDTSVSLVVSHSLLVYPSIPLTQRGRYGFIVTRRVLVDPSHPFDGSPFFRAALDTPEEQLNDAAKRVRGLAGEVIEALDESATPPIQRDDVALALRITVRSTDSVADDVLAMKTQVLAAAPPSYVVTAVEPQPDSSPLAAVVRGTWQAPEWREDNPRRHFARDEAGTPVQVGVKNIPFTLALPKAAVSGKVPIAMYQHGNPGSSEAEVPSSARRSLANDGFAVVGFTDVLNRELSAGITDDDAAILAQVAPVLEDIIEQSRIPDYWLETRGEMLAFLRMLDGLGTLDVLPIGAPDGVPELDPTAPRVYLGISEGGNNGQGFLPYAPEIRAAAVVVGGARLGEVLVHQAADVFLNTLGAIFRSLTPADIWVGVSLFQTIYDNQDPHNHARFLYRDPFEVAGTMRKPSVLAVEGLNDGLVPNHATDSMAWSMGPLPHLQPVQRPVPFLQPVTGPITANIDAQTTAAFFQFVPNSVPGIPVTPGCEAQPEGHYCAQTAPAALLQRSIFFTSALDGVPTIVDPFSAAAEDIGGTAGDPIVW